MMPSRRNTTVWAMVGVLLLAAFLTSRQLNADALSWDELRTYIVAGGAHHGPISYPMGVLDRVTTQSPDQALGFPLVARPWGDLVGWTELGTRVLPYLAGMLTIALIYRTGRELFSPAAGLSAALILATSILYITYMHKFRVFTIASLAATGIVWGYYRVMLSARRPGWLPQVVLVLSGIVVTYAHYFVVPLLGGVGLYHLLFAPKTRRWWRPVLLFIPVLALFALEIPLALGAVGHNYETRPWLEAQALAPLEIAWQMLRFFGNGYAGLTLGLLAVSLFMVSRPPQQATRRHLFYLWFVGLVTLTGVIVMNELAQVFVLRRMRYIIGMWVPLSLVAGAAVWQLGRWNRWLGAGVLALWVSVGLFVNIQDELMTFESGDEARIEQWRELVAPIFQQGEPDDAFVFVGYNEPRLGHYTHGLQRRVVIEPYQELDERVQQIDETPRLWFVLGREDNQEGNLSRFYEYLDQNGYDYCDFIYEDQDFLTRLYTRSQAFCPGGEPQMVFGEVATLMRSEQVRQGDSLTLNTGWQLSPDMALNTYSVGFHIYDDAGEFVTQQDVGLGASDGPYTPVSATLDVGDLEAGEYDVRVIFYNWRTGERLPVVQGASPFELSVRG